MTTPNPKCQETAKEFFDSLGQKPSASTSQRNVGCDGEILECQQQSRANQIHPQND